MKGATVMMVMLLAGGCATTEVNPPVAKAETGYVDFYADDDSGLCWQIERLRNNDGKVLIQEFRERTNGVVRLAFPPGEHRFRITFLNRAVLKPGIAKVSVEDGNITPVRVSLLEIGKAQFETRDVRVGGTLYGRLGRSTRLRASEGATFRVEAEAQSPVAYRPKEKMPFALEKSG
jgi:hypothetical protein